MLIYKGSFVFLLIIWFIFSQKINLFFLISATLAIILAILFKIFAYKQCFNNTTKEINYIFRVRPYFFYYLCWVMYQAILSSIHIMKQILNTKVVNSDGIIIKIPVMNATITQKYLLANSITFTPGTIAANFDADSNELEVHAFDNIMAESLIHSYEDMIQRVKKAIL